MSAKDEGPGAIVTGATGAIGRVVVRLLLEKGVRVAAGARSCVPGDELERYGVEAEDRVFSRTVDVADELQARALVEFAASEFGRIDFLIHAAGSYGAIGLASEVKPADWRQALETNLIGGYHIAHHTLPHMIAAQRGSIINVAGGGSTGPLENLSSYAVSKAGLVRLSDTLAQEVRDQGITVNAILPGAIDSAMQDQLLAAGDRAGPWYPKIKALREQGQGDVPATLTYDLLEFLLFGAGRSLTGKLISARYDGFAKWDKEAIRTIGSSELFTLRRLDPVTLQPIFRIETLAGL